MIMSEAKSFIYVYIGKTGYAWQTHGNTACLEQW